MLSICTYKIVVKHIKFQLVSSVKNIYYCEKHVQKTSNYILNVQKAT